MKIMDRNLFQSSSTTTNETEGLRYTLYINFVIFGILLLFFECVRHIKHIYLKRVNNRFNVSFEFKLIH